jgi:hypothetical protein
VSALSRTKRYTDEYTPERVSRLNQQRRQIAARWFRDADLGGRSTTEMRSATDLMEARDARSVSRMVRRMDDSGQEALLDPEMPDSTRHQLYDTWQ